MNEPPSDGQWRAHHQAMFWDSRPPWEVKFSIEKATGQLLTRRPEERLAYAAAADMHPGESRLVLRLEAVLPGTNLYRLEFDFSQARDFYADSRKPYTELDFRQRADTIFARWTRTLQVESEAVPADAGSPEAYGRLMREAIEHERQLAEKKEDEAPIRAAQNAVLEAVRGGKRFSTSHHEGGSSIGLRNGRFVRSDWGEDPGEKVFGNDGDFLAFLREYFDWPARKETYPHRPPELDVWRFIERQFE